MKAPGARFQRLPRAALDMVLAPRTQVLTRIINLIVLLVSVPVFLFDHLSGYVTAGGTWGAIALFLFVSVVLLWWPSLLIILVGDILERRQRPR